MNEKQPWPIVQLGQAIRHRKAFITIDDFAEYQRCRVQLHAKGIVLRDIISGAGIQTKQQQVCRAGDFLVAEIDAKVGGFGVVPAELEGAIVSSHYFLYEIEESRLDRRFLDYYIRTRAFRDQVEAQGSTNYAAIRPQHVLGYTIPLPPLAEQQRIVARIDALAARIEEAKGLRAQAMVEVEATWESVLSTVFQDGLEPSKTKGTVQAEDLLLKQAIKYRDRPVPKYNGAHPENPTFLANGLHVLPSGWVWTDIGSVLTHLVDCVNDTPDFSETATDFVGLKSTNIRPYKLDLSQRWYMTEQDFERWNRREPLRAGDIVLTREAPMGNACILPDGLNLCLTQRLLLLRPSEIVLSQYLLHYLNSSHFQRQVFEASRGLTAPHIRVKDAPNFLIPVAPTEDQHHIVAFLEDLQGKLTAVRRLQAETQAELDALLPSVLDRAFRGEL